MSMRGVAYEAGTILSQNPEFEKVSLSENAEDLIENYMTVSVQAKEDTRLQTTYSKRCNS